MSDPKIKRIGDLLGGGDVEREVAPGVSPELAAELHQHFAGLTDSHRARLIERWGEVIRTDRDERATPVRQQSKMIEFSFSRLDEVATIIHGLAHLEGETVRVLPSEEID